MTAQGWYKRRFGWVPRPVRQVIIAVIGGTLLLLAIAGMILPIIPGVIFIPFALAILAVEFAFAARWLLKIKKTASGVQHRFWSGGNASKAESVATPDHKSPVKSADANHALNAGNHK